MKQPNNHVPNLRKQCSGTCADVYSPQPIRGNCDFESLHRLIAKIHAYQTSGESSVFAQEAINGPGHFLRLAALRADDDACVMRGEPVQADVFRRAACRCGEAV